MPRERAGETQRRRRQGLPARGSVTCALAGQQTPNGYYNLERTIGAAARRGVEIGLCGTCMDARGVRDDQLVERTRRSTLEELADWTLWADRVVTF